MATDKKEEQLFVGNQKETFNLFRKRKVAIKMLIRRGYKISPSEGDISYQDFMILYKKNRHHLYFPNVHPANENGKGIFVFFEQEFSDKFSKKTLEMRYSQINQKIPNLDRLFFVLKQSKKKTNAFVVNELKSNPKYAKVKILPNVYPFDINDNYLVSPARKIEGKERELLIKVRGDPKKYPKLLLSDTIVKDRGGKVGDIFEISRYGGREVVYKYVEKEGVH